MLPILALLAAVTAIMLANGPAMRAAQTIVIAGTFTLLAAAAAVALVA